ncbi:MAG: hypothetical protein KAI06_05500, partial [Anaerolineales bacterium]|nr:hypothetical protein [Anaerolineales bacterium]
SAHFRQMKHHSRGTTSDFSKWDFEIVSWKVRILGCVITAVNVQRLAQREPNLESLRWRFGAG